jgi:hypothetical protein
MLSFRIALDNYQQFEIDVEMLPLGVGERELATATVYRCVNDARDALPLCRRDGAPMQFHAWTERDAFGLACDVLQLIYESRVRQVSRAKRHDRAAASRPTADA